MKLYTTSVEETQALASTIAKHILPRTVILLEGPLGSGKTTFTQAFGKALGIKRAIKSPTYTIVKEYPLDKGMLIHIDAYRLEDGGAETIDLDRYLDEDTIILIEWATFLEEYLPEDRIKIIFRPKDNANEREILIKNEGQLFMDWQALLSEV